MEIKIRNKGAHMAEKNYTKVVIDGRMYTLGGQEDEAYLQRMASYINHTIALLTEQGGFYGQTGEVRNLLILLNMASDYLHEADAAQEYKRQLEEREAELYGLKHEMIEDRMKLDELLANQESASKEDGKTEISAEMLQEMEELKAQNKKLFDNVRMLEGKNRALAERYSQCRKEIETLKAK